MTAREPDAPVEPPRWPFAGFWPFALFMRIWALAAIPGFIYASLFEGVTPFAVLAVVAANVLVFWLTEPARRYWHARGRGEWDRAPL